MQEGLTHLNPSPLAITASTDELNLVSDALNLPGKAGNDTILHGLWTLQVVNASGKFIHRGMSWM